MSSEKPSAENSVNLTPLDYDPGVIEITDIPVVCGTVYTGMTIANTEHYYAPNPKEELLMDMIAYLKELNNADALIPFDSTKTRLNDILLKAQRVI